MDYPARFEWQTRCEFNAYCKRTLRNELIDACRERKSRKRHEVSFADLTPQEEKQLYTVDRYFVNEDEEAFCAGGLKITAKLLAEALHSLPDEKRQAVLLYYFFDMTDVEIAELMKVPRSTAQYRRTRSFELLNRYLAERADEWDELKHRRARLIALPGHFSRDKGRPGSHEHCHAALPKLHSPPVYPKNPRRARQYLLRSRRGLAGTAAIKAHAGCPIL